MKLSRSRLQEQKSENIVVVILMVVIIVLVFALFGWSAIEEWFGDMGMNNTLLIVGVSLLFGIFGFFGSINNKGLRILFKLLATPAVIFIVVVLFLLALLASSNTPEAKARQESLEKAKAADAYKSAARRKANAVAKGDYKGAAYAQQQMDESMADMISASNADKMAYKSAAHNKASAVVRGNRNAAAYAQSRMDEKMADILKKK